MKIKQISTIALFLFSLAVTQPLLASDSQENVKFSCTTISEIRNSLPSMIKNKWPGMTDEEVAGTVKYAKEEIDHYEATPAEALNDVEHSGIIECLKHKILKPKYPAMYIFSTMFHEQLLTNLGADPEMMRDNFIKESSKFIGSGLSKGLSLAEANERAFLMKIAKECCEDSHNPSFFETRLPLAPEAFKFLFIESYGDHFKDDMDADKSMKDFLLIAVKETVRKFEPFKPRNPEASDAYYEALSAWIWDQELPTQAELQHVVEQFK